MQHVWLDMRDGQWSTRALTDDEAGDARAKGCTVVTVRAEVWTAWRALLDQMIVFDSLWTMLDNAAYAEREAKQ